MFIDVDLYPGLKIFRDNLEKIKDSVIDDTFIRHPSWEALIHQFNDPKQNVDWYSSAIIVSNSPVKHNAEKYKFLVDLYNELDVPNKLGIGFSKFSPGGYVKSHKDHENAYRYHLCLQSEKDKAYVVNDGKKLIFNEGDDFIINTGKTHSAFNESKTTERINLVVDFVIDEKYIENYHNVFGFGEDWR